nr:hypothetical protein Itr_chr13CG03240 [Ipomoea trifida]
MDWPGNKAWSLENHFASLYNVILSMFHCFQPGPNFYLKVFQISTKQSSMYFVFFLSRNAHILMEKTLSSISKTKIFLAKSIFLHSTHTPISTMDKPTRHSIST